MGLVALLVIAFGAGTWFVTGRWLRRLEHSSWALARARQAAADWSAQPSSNSVTVIIIAAFLAIPFAIFVSETASTDAHELVAYAVMIALSVPIAILHRVPGSNRALKYALVLTVLGVFWLKLIALQVLTKQLDLNFLKDLVKGLHAGCGSLFQRNYENTVVTARHLMIQKQEAVRLESQVLWWSQAGFTNFGVPFGIAAAIAIAVTAFAQRATSLHGVYHLIVGIGRYIFIVAAVALACADAARWLSAESIGLVLLTAYITARYEITQHVGRHPILYLRSFSGRESATVYGRLVAPVASKYGVLLGVVHEAQSPGELFTYAHPTLRARLLGCPAQEWQPWVETLLRQASLVIIDLTHSTPGVQWELTAAQRILPASRILMIGPENSAQAAGLFFRGSSPRTFRRHLHEWLRGIVDRSGVTRCVAKLILFLTASIVAVTLMSGLFKDIDSKEEVRLNVELDRFESSPKMWEQANCLRMDLLPAPSSMDAVQ